MASQTDICNRALQILGAASITSLTENSKAARACNLAYDASRKRELRINNWNFAIKRAQLAAAALVPVVGTPNSFLLPGDFIKLLPPDYQYNYSDRDWQIEGNSILTADSAPLNIRYIYNAQNTALFDSAFAEALSSRMALAMCDGLTQSNTKLQIVQSIYKEAIQEARLCNALENPPTEPVTDIYITCRM